MLKNGYFGALIFQEIEFFVHLKYNFKTSWPQKISKDSAKITLISMITKMPLILMLKSKLVMTYSMFVLLRPQSNEKEKFQRTDCHSIDFHVIRN